MTSKKIWLWLTPLLALIPSNAYAAESCGTGDKIAEFIVKAITGIAMLTNLILRNINSFAAKIGDFMLVTGENSMSISAIKTLQTLVYDIINLGFIGILLVLGISMMLGLPFMKGDAKGKVGKFILAVIGINFMYKFTGLVLDINNGLTHTIITTIKGMAGNKASAIQGPLTMMTDGGIMTFDFGFLNNKSLFTGLWGGCDLPFYTQAIEEIMRAVMVYYITTPIIQAMFVFIWRIMIMWALIITSPIAVLGFLPKVGSLSTQWWTKFINFAFFPLKFTAIVAVGFFILKQKNILGGGINQLLGRVIINVIAVIVIMYAIKFSTAGEKWMEKAVTWGAKSAQGLRGAAKGLGRATGITETAKSLGKEKFHNLQAGMNTWRAKRALNKGNNKNHAKFMNIAKNQREAADKAKEGRVGLAGFVTNRAGDWVQDMNSQKYQEDAVKSNKSVSKNNLNINKDFGNIDESRKELSGLRNDKKKNDKGANTVKTLWDKYKSAKTDKEKEAIADNLNTAGVTEIDKKDANNPRKIEEEVNNFLGESNKVSGELDTLIEKGDKELETHIQSGKNGGWFKDIGDKDGDHYKDAFVYSDTKRQEAKKGIADQDDIIKYAKESKKALEEEKVRVGENTDTGREITASIEKIEIDINTAEQEKEMYKELETALENSMELQEKWNDDVDKQVREKGRLEGLIKIREKEKKKSEEILKDKNIDKGRREYHEGKISIMNKSITGTQNEIADINKNIEDATGDNSAVRYKGEMDKANLDLQGNPTNYNIKGKEIGEIIIGGIEQAVVAGLSEIKSENKIKNAWKDVLGDINSGLDGLASTNKQASVSTIKQMLGGTFGRIPGMNKANIGKEASAEYLDKLTKEAEKTRKEILGRMVENGRSLSDIIKEITSGNTEAIRRAAANFVLENAKKGSSSDHSNINKQMKTAQDKGLLGKMNIEDAYKRNNMYEHFELSRAQFDKSTGKMTGIGDAAMMKASTATEDYIKHLGHAQMSIEKFAQSISSVASLIYHKTAVDEGKPAERHILLKLIGDKVGGGSKDIRTNQSLMAAFTSMMMEKSGTNWHQEIEKMAKKDAGVGGDELVMDVAKALSAMTDGGIEGLDAAIQSGNTKSIKDVFANKSTGIADVCRSKNLGHAGGSFKI